MQSLHSQIILDVRERAEFLLNDNKPRLLLFLLKSLIPQLETGLEGTLALGQVAPEAFERKSRKGTSNM